MSVPLQIAMSSDAGHRGWLAALSAIIVCYVAVSLRFVGHYWVTTAGTTMVLTTMIAYCAVRMRRGPIAMRWRWIMLILAFLFWMNAFWAIQWLALAYGNGDRLYFDYLFYLLRLAPYLMILGIAGQYDEGNAYRLIDIAQAILLMGLLVYLIRPALFPASSLPGPDWNSRVSLYHHIGSIAVALLALLAIPAQPDLARHRFARALAALLSSYAVISLVLNELVFESAHPTPPGHVINTLVCLPFFLFLLIDTAPVRQREMSQSALIGMLMPTAFCGAAMAVAFAIGTLGSAIAAGVALIFMGLRAALLQRDMVRLQRFVARLVEQLPDAVCVVGLDGILKSANPAAMQLFGPVCVGHPFEPLCNALGTISEGDGTIETVSGGAFIMAEAALEGGRLVRLTDITTLRAVAREREEALQLLGHDIRAPYAAILTLLRLPSEPSVDALARHATQGLAIADDFVRLARARSAALVFEPVDFLDAVAEAVDMVSAKAHVHGVPLEDIGERHDDGLWVDGDRGLLIRAMQNLLDNAIRFAVPHNVIRYGTVISGDHASFEVSSTGKDLPPDRRADPFARFGGRADGIGLGLALVRVTSQRHGGSAAYRRDGERNVFTIAIPVGRPVNSP